MNFNAIYIAICFSTTLIVACNKHESSNNQNRSRLNLEYALLEGNTTNTSAGDQEQAERDSLIREVDTLQAKIKSRYTDLERERDRNLEFKTQLLGKTSRGCFFDQKIETLEIELNSSDAGFRENYYSNEYYSSLPKGNSKGFKIKLGTEMIITHDESQAVLFAGGSISTTKFNNLKVSDIQYVTIEKQGYSIEKGACTETKVLGGCKKEAIYETNRYQMDGIKIIVNGETIYSKTLDDSFTFEMKNSVEEMIWKDEGLKVNAAWINAGKIDKCSPQQ